MNDLDRDIKIIKEVCDFIIIVSVVTFIVLVIDLTKGIF